MTAETSGAVRVVRDGYVLLISITRPHRRNAVDAAVARGIAAAMDELDTTSGLRVGVLHGEGGTFCAGLDLAAPPAGARTPGRGFAGIVERPSTKPLVAAVEGWALGGGFEIALACDLVTAGRSARFGLPEVTRGLVARGGGAVRLPRRIPPAIAMELLLTGVPLGAPRAAELGLVNRLVDDGDALVAARDLADRIAANAPMSVRATKAIATSAADWPQDEMFTRQAAISTPVFDSADAQEGIAAFREKRPPRWQDA